MPADTVPPRGTRRRPGMPALVAALVLAVAPQARGARSLQPDPQAPHGAATPDRQLEVLDGLGVAGVAPPARVDPLVFQSFIPDDSPQSPERIALGRKLFFDPRLSADGTVSCATCHDMTRSGTDLRPVSEGIADQLGRRNAPTVFNVAMVAPLFWDGRARDLEHQAGMPILNPVEMGMKDEESVVRKLRGIPEYAKSFQEVFGRAPHYRDLERAIAAFERTLVFLDAPFDRFLSGDDDDAISGSARRGWALYNGKARCTTCHPFSPSNPLGTDMRFHNVGVSARHQDFEALAFKALAALKADDSEKALDTLAVGTDLSELGRFMVTRNVADIGGFRTPQIRNVGISAPYMHDGSMHTLWDVMDHYNKGGEPNPYLDGGMEALALEESEIDDIVAFLFTLTDGRFAEENAKAFQTQRERAAETRPFRAPDIASRRTIDFELRLRKDGGK